MYACMNRSRIGPLGAPVPTSTTAVCAGAMEQNATDRRRRKAGELRGPCPDLIRCEWRLVAGMKGFRALTVCLGLGALAALGLAKGKGDAAKGKVVFQQCALCHNAESAEKKVGPGLKSVFQREKLQNGKKVTEPNIRAKIEEGGNGMPPYKDMLSEQEKDDLVAYLKTL